METFITRIELYNVSHDADKYEQLHENMKLSGFERTIYGSDKITYHLPTAEYCFIGNVDVDTVFNLAQISANSVTASNAVFISQLKTAKWDGLVPVKV